MVIHVEGMGWLGSVVAWHLHRAGYDFTWHDIDARFVAWAASTGIVYPTGNDTRAESDWATWLRWVDEPPWEDKTGAQACSFWFNHRNPPHGGTYRLFADLGWARMASLPAVQVDVPRLVSHARSHFSAQRTDGPPAGAHTLIRAHGFTPERLVGYLWGWSAPVELTYPAELEEASRLGPPTFYARRNRYTMAYAYKAAHEPGVWLAGSATAHQLNPRTLATAHHVDRWRRTIEELLPRLRVEAIGDVRQGWRPKAATAERLDVEVTAGAAGAVITAPPLRGSGVRLAPTVAAQIMEALR